MIRRPLLLLLGLTVQLNKEHYYDEWIMSGGAEVSVDVLYVGCEQLCEMSRE